MDSFNFHPSNFTNEPDTTQRSIIAEAEKALAGITVQGNTVDVPVMRKDLPVFVPYSTPQQWDTPGYIVTFRRTKVGWEAVEIK